ncbi:hypothetical protein D0861_03734 [Hortaea werneckii]|uniref:Zn(2)-C6 fungal-type domain-containing protein n=1 Tax=Hortaea werneckii TaxID=91943 RepID=A0A3M7FNG4_HORWE|nr:hypothetical protein D0861_03734 [Hortaea werneckii]
MAPASTSFHSQAYPTLQPPRSDLSEMPSLTQSSASATQTQTLTEATDRARAYKSRNKRPCDFCRYKKAACHLDHQPPCELCIRYNKECTFVESPAKRRRPNDSNASNELGKSSGAFNPMSAMNGNGDTISFANALGGSVDMQQNILGWENGMQPFHISGIGMTPEVGASEFTFDPALYQDNAVHFENPFDPIAASVSTIETVPKVASVHNRHDSSMETSPLSQAAHLPLNLTLPFDTTSGEPSLDNQASSNAQVVGMSGESDPYLLARYRFDQYNEASFQSLRMRKMNSGPSEDGCIPSFFTIQHNALASKAQPVERSEVIDKYRSEVEEMVSEEVGKRLIRLFYKYVQPYFPILTREGHDERDVSGVRNLSSIPTCILAAIYGHALPFCAWDEKLCVEVYTPPSADALFRIAWLACLPMLHTPSLAVLQTLLLLVQRRPTNKHVSDTPMKFVMMTTAVSVAQALGLHRDCSDWPLPSWEIKVRRRLGWATFIQDKWIALNMGRSSHIQSDDWDVNPLTENDFPEIELEGPGSESGSKGQHFIKLCELTVIVDDIMHSLYSLKATRSLHNSLDATLEVAKPLRLRLTEWYQSLPPGLLPQPSTTPVSPGSGRRKSAAHELDGNGSLHLAYITAKIELFRAMLRPRATDANSAALLALRTGALTVAGEMFEFLEGLQPNELEAFWASYARTNFTIASSFMLLLFVTSTTLHDAKESLCLLTSWRSLLRVKSRSCDLLNLALLRLDGVFVAGMEKLIELSPAAAQAWAEGEHSS